MSSKQNYIKWLRSKVGQEKVILVFAGGCIFNDAGEVLLQKRGDSNKWGFPGGAIELGETPQMAVIREVKEETGLDVRVDKMIGVYTDCDMRYPNGYFSLNDLPELFCKQHEELAADMKEMKLG